MGLRCDKVVAHNIIMFFHIIDDQPFICLFISEVLSDLGHETEVFTSPERYLEYLESPHYSAPAALFSDITMPVMNGYQLLDRVLSQHPKSQFVIMSGSDEIESEYRKSCSAFLRKPFNLSDIEDAVVSVSLSYQDNSAI